MKKRNELILMGKYGFYETGEIRRPKKGEYYINPNFENIIDYADEDNEKIVVKILKFVKPGEDINNGK